MAGRELPTAKAHNQLEPRGGQLPSSREARVETFHNAHAHAQMDLHHRPSTAELSAELDGTARRALDARVPFASRKEVERYSQLLPALYDDRGPIEYPTTRLTAPPPEPSLPDSEPESDERAAPATGARMPEGASQHTRSVEGLSVGNVWSGSALVSGFSARDESSAFIPGWDTPPMVSNWSYYKRGWRNGTSTTTDPVRTRHPRAPTQLHTHAHAHAHAQAHACTHARTCAHAHVRTC